MLALLGMFHNSSMMFMILTKGISPELFPPLRDSSQNVGGTIEEVDDLTLKLFSPFHASSQNVGGPIEEVDYLTMYAIMRLALLNVLVMIAHRTFTSIIRPTLNESRIPSQSPSTGN
jgi:hypothetical protein